MKVSSLVGKATTFKAHPTTLGPLVLPDTLMGIEIEIDSNKENYSELILPEIPFAWYSKYDGSLREGREYVLDKPYKGDELLGCIDLFFSCPGTYERSITAGTHIHINMLEEDDTQEVVSKIAQFMYVFDPVFFAIGDNDRKFTGFCTPVSESGSRFISNIKSCDSLSFGKKYHRNGTYGRYSGLNLASLLDYGSLEFRYFPTALTSEELVSWVNLVQSVKLMAKSDARLEDINTEQDYNNFLDRFFSNWKNYFLEVLPYSRVDKLIAEASFECEGIKPKEDTCGKGLMCDRFLKYIDVPIFNEELDYEGSPPVVSTNVYHVENSQWLIYNDILYYKDSRSNFNSVYTAHFDAEMETQLYRVLTESLPALGISERVIENIRCNIELNPDIFLTEKHFSKLLDSFKMEVPNIYSGENHNHSDDYDSDDDFDYDEEEI